MSVIRGSFGDYNSYGSGRCGHMGPYPGCPKCVTKFGNWARRANGEVIDVQPDDEPEADGQRP